jgi:hypothetical protein
MPSQCWGLAWQVHATCQEKYEDSTVHVPTTKTTATNECTKRPSRGKDTSRIRVMLTVPYLVDAIAQLPMSPAIHRFDVQMRSSATIFAQNAILMAPIRIAPYWFGVQSYRGELSV